MRSLYLPYFAESDRDKAEPGRGATSYCIVGQDRRGKPFGVGAGATLEACEARLRDWVWEVLDAHAAQGEDRFDDLHPTEPRGDHVAFDPVELLPIRLKLARSRAGLRQSDMAARLGITQQAYAKLERPGANPTLRTIVQTEQVLGSDLLLLNVEPPKHEVDDVGAAPVKRTGRRIRRIDT